MAGSGSLCPMGGTLPAAKPVERRTNPASALPMRSPRMSRTFFSSTRLLPLASTRTGCAANAVRKTSDLTICAVPQPSASAALGGGARGARKLPFLEAEPGLLKRATYSPWAPLAHAT